MSSTRGRKRARAPSIASNSETQVFENEETAAPGGTRRYSTRHSTQVSRPGVAAGLAKRHKTDIQAVAAIKKAGEVAKRNKKEKQIEAKAVREEEATRIVAAMLDRKGRQERQEEEEIERIPTSEDECVNAPTRHSGTIAEERANDSQQRSPSVHSSHHGDDTLNDDLHDEDAHGPRRIQPSNSPPHSLYSEQSEDSDSSVVEQPKTLKQKQTQSKGNGKGKTSENCAAQGGDDNQVVATLTRKKKPTETERRAARVQKMRTDIADNREAPASTGANMRDKSARAPSAPSKSAPSKGKGRDGDAFTADYRSRSRTAPATPASKKKAADDHMQLSVAFIGDKPAPTKGPFAQDEWAAATFNFIHDAHTPSTSTLTARRAPDPAPLSDEEVGGLDDFDAATPVPTRQQKRSMPVVRGPAKNTMVGVLPMSLIEGDEVSESPKKTRAPRKKLSLIQSRGVTALVPWIQATMISVIIPSLIKFFGSHSKPWELDNDFPAIFKAVLTRIHPGLEETVAKGDKEWRYARQGVYDWRSNFGRLAMRLVTKTAKTHPSPTAISIWATNALARGGEATYSNPNLSDHKAARGALHTPLHIQLLASHYGATEGAIIDSGYPVAALSLATVAIRRAYTAWKTGSFIAQEDFTENTYGLATMQTRNGSVKGLEDIPHRFDGLVAMAMGQLPSFKRAEAENVEQAANNDDAYAAVDPPTSPAAADYD